MATVGRREEGDGADRWAPHGGDVRERWHICRSAQGQREYVFWKIRQHGLGRVGRAGSRRPAGQSGPVHGGAGPDGPKSEENSFLNKNYIFEYTNALEICTRRFWRNLDMRIFPKFF
jgi:hypothetical protein